MCLKVANQHINDYCSHVTLKKGVKFSFDITLLFEIENSYFKL